MHPVFPNNTRYILELERNELIKKLHEFEGRYGAFEFAFLTSLEVFALLAYILIVFTLNYYKKTRTKTNFVISLWAVLNFLVLSERIVNSFNKILTGDEELPRSDFNVMADFLSSLARSYGTSLSVVWLFSKYNSKPRYNHFMYFLMFLPSLICFSFIFYYFNFNRFIYEVYGPGSDVVNVVVYLSVAFIFALCKIFANSRNIRSYALLVSLVNLITNLPLSLMTIYLRFALDISWVYKFQLYFVDAVINFVSCTSAFAVLFLVILYNENVKFYIFRKHDETMRKVPVHI